MNIKDLEKVFGIEITDEELFTKALTHSSYTKENSLSSLLNYERLEFFGDAVLKLAVSEILMEKFPTSNEGELTKIRSIIVSDATLSVVAKELGLNEFLILGKNAEKSGERTRASINACAVEALIGAYFLTGKKREIVEFLGKIFEPKILDVKNNFAKYNAKEILQEYTQKRTKELPVYHLVREFGPQHDPSFEIEVIYQNKVLACEIGKSKKEAEQKCAYEACKKLGVINE